MKVFQTTTPTDEVKTYIVRSPFDEVRALVDVLSHQTSVHHLPSLPEGKRDAQYYDQNMSLMVQAASRETLLRLMGGEWSSADVTNNAALAKILYDLVKDAQSMEDASASETGEPRRQVLSVYTPITF